MNKKKYMNMSSPIMEKKRIIVEEDRTELKKEILKTSRKNCTMKRLSKTKEKYK